MPEGAPFFPAFLLIGMRMLKKLKLSNAKRNHQGKGNVLLFPRSANSRRDGHVQCRERLGGLLRYYHQEAALWRASK